MAGTTVDIITKSHTPKTNRILVFGAFKAYCPASTNITMNLKCGSISKQVAQLDGYAGSAGYQNVYGIYVFDVTPNTAVNVVLNMGAGNSGAKVMSYNRSYLNIIDL